MNPKLLEGEFANFRNLVGFDKTLTNQFISLNTGSLSLKVDFIAVVWLKLCLTILYTLVEKMFSSIMFNDRIHLSLTRKNHIS